ncbi:hypothetical protein FRC00_010023 [Tulasnella sp. 408]|nr:hypothetical protein FRC00_010023 [Tulasnella sp. 408]
MDFLTSTYPLQEQQLLATGSSTSKPPAKRKSDASVGADDDDDDYAPASKPAAKKPRASKAKAVADPHVQAKQLVQAIVTNPNGFTVPSDQAAMRTQLFLIAQYASALSVGDAAGAVGTRIVKALSEDELEAAATKLARAALSQIKKQMAWKPSCKGGSAKWMYQGVAPDPAVFQRLMQLPEPAKYKATKITLEQLYDILDTNYIETSIRYGSLRITSPNINVKWNKDSGEFSFSGTYGL